MFIYLTQEETGDMEKLSSFAGYSTILLKEFEETSSSATNTFNDKTTYIHLFFFNLNFSVYEILK